MLQKVNAGMEQHLAVNKSIAAQLRALTESAPAADPEPEPEPEPEPKTEEPPKESTRGSLKKLLAGAF